MHQQSIRRILALAVSGVALVAACAAPAAAPSGDVAAGQAAYASKGCAACHGANGEGGIGPKIAGTSLSQSAVTDRVRKGGGQMPAFDASKVSDQEIANIYAFLKSKQ